MGAIPVVASRAALSAFQNVKAAVGGNNDPEVESNCTVGFIERPPQLEPQKRIEDTIIHDWRWLALRSERRLVAQAKRRGPSRRIAEVLGENFDIDHFACFVPRTVLEAIADGRIRYSDDFDIIIENFNAAVVFCDASGFTALTEALDQQPNGAEKLGECINRFFAPLIQIIHFWGGDIIKFSGDALTIVWPVDDEQPAGRTGEDSTTAYRIDKRKACRLACQCCLDLHTNLNYFPTPVVGKFFTLHIGVGYGKVTILQVGGTLDRWEYVVAGPPMQEISVAEPLAGSGETVISPTVVEALGGDEGAHLQRFLDGGGFAKLFELRGEKVNPPPSLENIVLQDSDVELLKRFIPPAVFKRLTAGYNVFINELRRISVVFVGVHGLDVSTERGSQAAHRLMQVTQKAAYTMEGSVNKFLVDDKGVLILIMFGLPPVYHLDDALRAVMAALRVVDGLKSLGLTAGIGVATGRVWCGTVGCDLRKEYTAMGDTVNLAARLMGKGSDNEINCDTETKCLCEDVMAFKSLPAVRMKGKANLVPVFQPIGTMRRQAVLQTTTGEPVSTWKGWKYKKRLYRLFFPGYEFRQPIIQFDKPTLDYPLACGPLFPWEYVEPWLPSLRPTVDLGGVSVVVGKETEGATDLVQYIADLAVRLGRKIFLCSNMPDSTHLNIGNVPLLAWRKLNTEMVEQWGWSRARDAKGYSRVDRDNSMYGLTKELVHPIFHWHLHEMKSVIHGLVMPYEVPENQARDQSQTAQVTQGSLFRRLLNKAPLKSRETNAKEPDAYNMEDISLVNCERRSTPGQPYPPTCWTPTTVEEDQTSLAPIICSLVNGYTMYECSIVVLHVRSGTSLFASVSWLCESVKLLEFCSPFQMDGESWKVARLVGRTAMMRRRRKIELDTKELKRWRRHHSRNCLYCRGLIRPYVRLNGDIVVPEWTSRCRPPPSRYFPPFIFVLVTTDMTGHIAEQQELVEWAHESNAFVLMKSLSPVETGSYLAHCLSVPRRALPENLIEYVHRISAGIPKYIYLTAGQLSAKQAIVIEDLSFINKVDASNEASQSTASQAGNEVNEYPGSGLGLGNKFPSLVTATAPEPPTGPSVGGRGPPCGTEFQLNAQILVGRSGISKGCETSDADSDRELMAPSLKLLARGGLMGRELTIYRFKQSMKWAPGSRRARRRGGGEVLSVDDCRVDQQLIINTLRDIETVGNVLVRRPRRSVKLANANNNPPDERRGPSQSGRDSGKTRLGLCGFASESVAAANLSAVVAAVDAQRLLEKEQSEKNPTASSQQSLQFNPLEPRSQTGTTTPGNKGNLPPTEQMHSTTAKEENSGPCRISSLQTGPNVPDQFSPTKLYPGRVAPKKHAANRLFIPPGPAEFATHLGFTNRCSTLVPGNYETSIQRQLREEATTCSPTQADTSNGGAIVSSLHTDGVRSPPGAMSLTAQGIRPYAAASAQADKKNLSVRVRVVRDLKKIPFVNELRAAAMSLMERLEPDEQLAAKVASVFPVAFTGFEIQAVYPRPMTRDSFQRMVDNLITKGMLESCDPPTEQQLQELDLIPLEPMDLHPTKKKHKHRDRNGDLTSPDLVRRCSSPSVKGEGASKYLDSSVYTDDEALADKWGFDDRGEPMFYRFTSIAFQHVVADLLMSAERSFLARISRKVICFRRTYGLSFLMRQINEGLIDSSMDYDEDREEPFEDDTADIAETNDLETDTAGMPSPFTASRMPFEEGNSNGPSANLRVRASSGVFPQTKHSMRAAASPAGSTTRPAFGHSWVTAPRSSSKRLIACGPTNMPHFTPNAQGQYGWTNDVP